MSSRPKLSIVIPVYNEANTCLELLRWVQKETHDKEIIIIDDCSTDGTRDLLQGLTDSNVRVLLNDRNRGKGYSIRRGFAEATGDITIIQDADLEYYPDEYGALIERIVDGKADVVYGTRFLGSHRAFLFYHYLGNTLLNLIANMLLNAYLTDLMTCYKAFRTPVVKSLTLRANRFGIEPEITAEIFKRGYRVYEVPISYNARSFDEGKKIKWSDFFGCVVWLIRTIVRGVDVGTDMLLKMRLMKNNNRWIYETIRPYLGTSILELGAGIGTMSRHLVGQGREVMLMEVDQHNAQVLKERFIGNPKVEIVQSDVADLGTVAADRRFDSVVAVNFLEHMEDQSKVLELIKSVLQPGGRLLITVPAHKVLFSEFDKLSGHQRRYGKKDLRAALMQAGFKVERMKHMNSLFAVGWLARFKILGSKRMPGLTARLGDKLIPLVAWVERLIPFPFGLALFCVASKDE